MGQKFRNNFSTTLTASITASSTALALTAAPSPAITLSDSDDFFLLTLVDKNGNREIVKCVGISGLNVTIGVALGVPSVDGRAQEDTTAIAITHTDDHEISMRTTAGTFDAILSDIADLISLYETSQRKISESKKFWRYENLLKHGSIAKDWTAGYTYYLDQYSIDWTKSVKKWILKVDKGLFCLIIGIM